jgi:hypothetical protein
MVCASAGIECYLVLHTNQAVVEISANAKLSQEFCKH